MGAFHEQSESGELLIVGDESKDSFCVHMLVDLPPRIDLAWGWIVPAIVLRSSLQLPLLDLGFGADCVGCPLGHPKSEGDAQFLAVGAVRIEHRGHQLGMGPRDHVLALVAVIAADHLAARHVDGRVRRVQHQWTHDALVVGPRSKDGGHDCSIVKAPKRPSPQLAAIQLGTP